MYWKIAHILGLVIEYYANIVSFRHSLYENIDKYSICCLLAVCLKFVKKVISAASYNIDTIYIMLYYTVLHCIIAYFRY